MSAKRVMSPEVRAYLQSLPRKKKPTLCSTPTDVLRVACDYARDHGHGENPVQVGPTAAYFRYATQKQIETLCRELPHACCAVRSRFGPRDVILFERAAVEAILKFLGLELSKYRRWIRARKERS